jgi:hypothetical protein
MDRVRTEFSDVTATASLVEAAPAPALLGAGANAGLIVVGTRGHGALMSFLLGSVSHAGRVRLDAPGRRRPRRDPCSRLGTGRGMAEVTYDSA